MNRQEFVERLRAALSGRLPSAMVADNVNYYEDYINVEIRKGRTEEDVLTMLGDPRLIAKTIIQANAGAGDVYNAADSYTTSTYGSADSGYRAGGAYSGAGNGYAADSVYRNGSAYDEDNSFDQHIFRIPGWIATIVTILVVLLIVGAVFSLLSFLMPLIIVMAVVLLMVKVFRDWLN